MPRTSKVDLPGCPAPVRALCCDTLGLVKVVEASAAGAAPQVVARWGQTDSGKATLCLSMPAESTTPEFAVARRNGMVDIMDSVNGAVHSELPVPTSLSHHLAGSLDEEDGNQACGLHMFRQDGSRARAVLTCTRNGTLGIQAISEDDSKRSAMGQADHEQVRSIWNVCDAGTVSCFRVDHHESHAVYGGKELDVHLWDLDRGSSVWSAKIPRKNNLGLVLAPHVTAVTYLSKGDHRKVVAGTGHHQVRLYDVDSQRRPILVLEHGSSPITSMVEEGDDYTVHVGTGNGNLSSLDMRTGQVFGAFKGGCAGSVRAIVRHPTLPLLASCGLDRYLRIHHVKTRQLLAKVFLKQQLSALAFDSFPGLQASKLREADVNTNGGRKGNAEMRFDDEDVDEICCSRRLTKRERKA